MPLSYALIQWQFRKPSLAGMNIECIRVRHGNTSWQWVHLIFSCVGTWLPAHDFWISEATLPYPHRHRPNRIIFESAPWLLNGPGKYKLSWIELMLCGMMTSSNESFSALLTICAGNSPVPGEFPAQRPVTRSFDVFFDLGLNKRLSKQSWGWWFGTLWHPL